VVTNESVLEVLRQAIDEVDEEILSLVAKRIELVYKIAEYKQGQSLPVYDPERERAVIDRLIDLASGSLDPQLVRRVFERIIDESRRVEQHQAIRAVFTVMERKPP
jgi:monofunctional chorismate mutase